MERLFDFIPFQHLPYFGFGQQDNTQILRGFGMWSRNDLYIGSDKTVGQVVLGRRIGRDYHQLSPCPSSVTGLLLQLATCRIQWGRIRRITHSGTQFNETFTQSVPVLADKNILPFTT